jgi:glycyl-tRNA synthetase
MNEMAHYAADCWDAEIQNSYGWTECVGIADRSAFDLSAHSGATGQPLQAFVEYKDGARSEDVCSLKLDKGKIGKTLGTKAQALSQYLTSLTTAQCLELEQQFAGNNNAPVKVVLGDKENTEVEIKREYITQFVKETKRVTGRHIIPGVIEPSFGIGRILYSVLEHAFYYRENDEQRTVLALPPAIAPVKVSVFPLLTSHAAQVPAIVQLLAENGISNKVDETATSIGRRYARTDEIGIPFAITVDHQTSADGTITLRERDSTNQVRVKIDEIISVLHRLIGGRLSWDDVQKTFPKVEVKE